MSDPKAWDRTLWNLAGSQSVSGENVTEYTALTYSAFWNAVQLISGTVGSLPLHLMQRKGKTKIFAENKPLYQIMHNRWNPFMTAMAGRETLAAHALTWGNGYAEKIWNGYGEIASLWPITPDRVTPMMEGGEIKYRITMQGEADITLPKEKILHIPGLGYDGLIGYSIVAMARKSIGLGMAMETFGSRFFGEGTHPAGYLKMPLDMKDPKAVREAYKEVYAGLGKTHQLMLLEPDMEYKEIGIPPEDSQFLESRQFQIPEIARWFNIPPHKLKDLTKSSFNNIESEQASFVMDCILPWSIRFEQNYWMQLLSVAEQKQGFYFKHILEGLLRANSKDRAEYLRLMIGNTMMTPNEARGKEDLNPSDNPLADELFVNIATIPLSKLEEYVLSKKSQSSGGSIKSKAMKSLALVNKGE